MVASEIVAIALAASCAHSARAPRSAGALRALEHGLVPIDLAHKKDSISRRPAIQSVSATNGARPLARHEGLGLEHTVEVVASHSAGDHHQIHVRLWPRGLAASPGAVQPEDYEVVTEAISEEIPEPVEREALATR